MIRRTNPTRTFFLSLSLIAAGTLFGCADASVPQARNVDIPSPVAAQKRKEAINEKPDSVMYLPLGEDVLVPERIAGDPLPRDLVGPFELRGETLAGALQLILADYDISIAFETQEGLTRQITVTNLRGELGNVINRVCSLADLYCSYEDGDLVVKDTQTFTVTLPPLADIDGNQQYIADIIQGLTAIIGTSGSAPVPDPTTRALIYSATQRTSKLAENYFQRLRANTAMIVFETYIWEVSLNAGNSTGIDWDAIEEFGKFNASISFNGSVAADFTNPVSIGLPTTQAIGASPTDIIQFLSQFGAVKAISQPQITVLSGASAELRVADTENYVSEVSQTINGDNTTTSVDTDSVDSGFTLTIGSSWDKSTVYANVRVNLTNVDQIEDFTFSDGGTSGTDTIIQLPQTTERELYTQIRVRPGDSVLIAGLVRERDNFNNRGPGFMQPIIPDSRTAQTDNLELVIMMRPRVIVYTSPDDFKYQNFLQSQAEARGQAQAQAQALAAMPLSVEAPAVTAAPTITATPAALTMSPEPVVTAAPAPIVPVAPVTALPPEPVPSTPVPNPPSMGSMPPAVEPMPVYTPSASAGYTPGYVSQSYASTAPEPVPADSYYDPTYLEPSYPAAPVTPAPPATADPRPLPTSIYNNRQTVNIYDAYERSMGGY
jgi:hypothetical protein